MSTMELEELELARAMDAALEGLLRIPSLLEAAAADRPPPVATHRSLLDLGWSSIAVPEALGGLELSWDQVVRLAAVGGRRLLPSAMRGEAFVLAPALAVLAQAGDSKAGEWLDSLLAGEIRGGAAAFAPGADTCVADLPPAARLVACLHGDRVIVAELDRDGISVEHVLGLDPAQGAAFVRLDRSAEATASIIGAAAAEIHRRWVVASLGEAFGAAQRCLELSCRYATEREQFGAKIVSFQAVSHRLAEMAVELEASDAGIGRLVAGLHQGDDGERLLLALSHSVPAATRNVCEGAIQVHGGAGFTWELGLHLFYRRVLTIQQELGGPSASARHAGLHYLASMKAGADD
jgi:alkylation response protein AidB-like acyl-CoA dehydrogenase